MVETTAVQPRSISDRAEIRGRGPLALVSLFLLAMLDISYVVVIPPAHYYALLDPIVNPVKIVESSILLLIVVAAMPLDLRRPSTIFLWLSLLIAYVPMLCLYGVRDYSRPTIYATAAFWLTICILVRATSPPTIRLVPRRDAWRLLWALYLTMLALSLGTIAIYAGLPILSSLVSDLNLAHAYTARAEFVDAGIPLHGYYLHWVAMIFNPLFFSLAALRRRWLACFAIFAVQLLVAAFVGMRTYFFVIPFVSGVLIVLYGRRPLEKVAAGFASIVAAGVFAYGILGNFSVYLLFTGRFLLDAAQLNFLYFDFFSRHGPVPFAYLFKFYLHLPIDLGYPYSDDPATTIGKVYYGQNIGAVSGSVADAFMNFGYWGLPLWAVGTVLMLILVDSLGRRVNLQLAGGMLVMSAVAMAQTFTVRVLFTTGFVWALVLLYLVSSTKSEEASEARQEVASSSALVGQPRHALFIRD